MLTRVWLTVASQFSMDDHSKVDDSPCIPYISGNTCSRLLSEFHILTEIGRGAFGDVIKVLYIATFCLFLSVIKACGYRNNEIEIKEKWCVIRREVWFYLSDNTSYKHLHVFGI